MPETDAQILKRQFRNKIFYLLQDIQDLQEMFPIVFGKNCFVSDKFVVAERQLQICNLELNNMTKVIDRITIDLESEKAVK